MNNSSFNQPRIYKPCGSRLRDILVITILALLGVASAHARPIAICTSARRATVRASA